MNVEGSQHSTSSFITAFDLKSVGSASSNISTGEYSANALLLIMLQWMLS